MSGGISLMKVWLLAQAVRADPRVKHAWCRAMLALLDHLNRTTGLCNPSHDALCQAANMKGSTLWDSLDGLERLGWIEARGSGGRHRTNSYTFNWEMAERYAAAKEQAHRLRVQARDRGEKPPAMPGLIDWQTIRDAGGFLPENVPVLAMKRPGKSGEIASKRPAMPGGNPKGTQNPEGNQNPPELGGDAAGPLKADFDTVFRPWPNKDGREDAYTAFVEVVSSGAATLDELCERVDRFLNSEEAMWGRPRTFAEWLYAKDWQDPKGVQQRAVGV